MTAPELKIPRGQPRPGSIPGPGTNLTYMFQGFVREHGLPAALATITI